MTERDQDQFFGGEDVPDENAVASLMFPSHGPEATATGADIGRRQHVAAHESGHTCVGWLLHLGVTGATIEGQGATFFGERRISPTIETVDLATQLQRLMPPLGASRDDVAVDVMHCVDNIICLMAGVVAERLVFGRALPGSQHDVVEAEALASIVVRSRAPASTRAMIDYCRCEARCLLESNVGAVLAVTFALLKHGELSGDQIGEIISRSRTNPA
jgi:hypothetical protein